MIAQRASEDFCAADGNAVRIERATGGGLVLVSYHEMSGASIRTEFNSTVAAMMRDFIDATFGRTPHRLDPA